MTDLLQTWASFYANHAAIRTLVAFVHVGALMAGGGLPSPRTRSCSPGSSTTGRRAGRCWRLQHARTRHRIARAHYDQRRPVVRCGFRNVPLLEVLLGKDGTRRPSHDQWRGALARGALALSGDHRAWRMLRLTGDREPRPLVSDHSWRRGAAQHRMMSCGLSVPS